MSRALIEFRFIFILGSPAHKYVLQLYMYVFLYFPMQDMDSVYRCVDKHVHYAWLAII